jgi:hypothetical protein
MVQRCDNGVPKTFTYVEKMKNNYLFVMYQDVVLRNFRKIPAEMKTNFSNVCQLIYWQKIFCSSG